MIVAATWWAFSARRGSATWWRFHNPESQTGLNIEKVAVRSLEIDPVNVYPVVPSSLSAAYQPLAEATSGKVVANTGDTAAALLSAITEIRMRPVALLAWSEYFAQPGETIVFDASTSYDPDSTVARFEWDFEGDGVVDQTTTTGTVTHAYGGPFDGTMQVRVHSADGWCRQRFGAGPRQHDGARRPQAGRRTFGIGRAGRERAHRPHRDALLDGSHQRRRRRGVRGPGLGRAASGPGDRRHHERGDP